MSSKHFVITVERQYGSGGRLTSERLARNWESISMMKKS